MFYPGLLDYYCPVSDDLLKLAGSVSQADVADCNTVERKKNEKGKEEREGHNEDNVTSPELFDDSLGTSDAKDGRETISSKPSVKDAITKLASEGRLTHKQASPFTLSSVCAGYVPSQWFIGVQVFEGCYQASCSHGNVGLRPQPGALL